MSIFNSPFSSYSNLLLFAKIQQVELEIVSTFIMAKLLKFTSNLRGIELFYQQASESKFYVISMTTHHQIFNDSLIPYAKIKRMEVFYWLNLRGNQQIALM